MLYCTFSRRKRKSHKETTLISSDLFTRSARDDFTINNLRRKRIIEQFKFLSH